MSGGLDSTCRFVERMFAAFGCRVMRASECTTNPRARSSSFASVYTSDMSAHGILVAVVLGFTVAAAAAASACVDLGALEGTPDAGRDGPLGENADAGHDVGPDVSQDAARDTPGMLDQDAPSWSPDCPADEPTVGTSCDVEGVQCEYPKGAKLQYDIACDDVVECSSGRWVDETFMSACHPDGPNPPECPAAYIDLKNGSSCSDQNIWCEYPAGVCQCVQSSGVVVHDGGSYDWRCNPGSGCPMPRARLGSACSMSGEICTYETCEYSQACTSGLWHGSMEACP
jgi:hypothetical protein